MGYWKKLANRYSLKSFTSGGWNGQNLEVWNPKHPLNAFVGAGSTGNRERIENDFESYVAMAYKSNGPVFACMLARQQVFSEARFQYRRFQNGRPQELFGDSSLDLLENPWPGGTTGELLVRMEQDVSLAGNFFATKADDAGQLGNKATSAGLRIVRLRPDWVTIIVGTKQDGIEGVNHAHAQVLGYLYSPQSATDALGFPRGDANITGEVLLTPEEVCHFSPIPDPIARFRGMSWLTPLVREIRADSLALLHKETFFDNSAVPNMVVKFDKDTSEDTFDEFVEKFKSGHQGAWNAYKTLFLMGGADVTPLTHDFTQLAFSQTVGKGESRIAAAAGVPPSWVGFSEGLQGSALNASNMAAARRRFADGTIRPMWRQAAASLQVLVTPPTGAELWFDERGIAFLREDARDRAEIMRISLNAIDSGIKSGFEPDAVVEAMRDEDLTALIGNHTGLVSVQMQPPVNPDRNANEQNQEEATIRQLQSQVVAALTTAGYAIDGIAQFLETGDASVLEKDPMHEQQQQAALDHQNAQAENVQADANNPRRDPNKPPPVDPNKVPPGGANSNVTNSGGTDKPKPKPASGSNSQGGSNGNS